MSDLGQSHRRTGNPDLARERTDVSARGILLAAAALVLIGIVTHLVTWWLLVVLQQRRQASNPPPTPWSRQRSGQLPPPPRLEGIDRMQEGQTAAPPSPKPPDSYGTVDANAGIVQIPLERAMRLIVEHDLLKTESDSPTHRATAAMPSGANSGRGRQEDEP
jgi:hypothetical protein